MEKVCTLLLLGQLYLKQEKCGLDLQQIEYLGHIVHDDTILQDSTKIQAMVDWTTPAFIKALKGFFGSH